MKKEKKYNRFTHKDPDLSQVSQGLIVKMSGWSQGTISSLEGLPRNKNLSYDALAAMPFIVKTAEESYNKNTGDLDKRKLELQCSKLQIEVDRMVKETIPVSTHEQIMTSRAQNFTAHIQQFFEKNLHNYCNKNLDELRELNQAHIAELMHSYSENHL